MKTIMKSLLLMLLVTLTITSCKKDEKSDENKQLAVKVTDGPFPYQFATEANIGFSKIELRNKATGDYVTVFEGNSKVNMVDYRNGNSTEITKKAVPAGTYDQVRVTISSADVKLSNNETFNAGLTTAQSVTSPIKPELVITNDDADTLLLDIDLSDSFVFDGFMNWITDITNITGIQSFNADVRAANLSETGSISGKITDANGSTVTNAEVYLLTDYNDDGINEKVISVTDDNGNYKFVGLEQGSYIVHCVTPQQHSGVASNVQVQIDNNTQLNITVN